MVTVGASEAIDIALRALVGPGDEVLVPQPSYVSYSPSVIFAGGTPVGVETTADTEFRLTPEALRAASAHVLASLREEHQPAARHHVEDSRRRHRRDRNRERIRHRLRTARVEVVDVSDRAEPHREREVARAGHHEALLPHVA